MTNPAKAVDFYSQHSQHMVAWIGTLDHEALIAYCKATAREAWQRQARGLRANDSFIEQEVYVLQDKLVWC